MLEAIIKLVDQLITNFTWRKFLSATVVIFLVFIAISAYESYTATFRLTRLEKSVILLEKLASIKATGILEGDERLASIYQQTSSDLQLLSSKPLSQKPAEIPLKQRFFGTFSAWSIICFILLILVFFGKAKFNVVAPFVTISAFIAAMGTAIPPTQYGMAVYYAYSVVSLVLVGYFAIRSSSKPKEQSNK